MKILKRIGIGLLVLVVIGFIAFPILKKQTKKASPEQTVDFKLGDTDIHVFYCSPSKKDRVIFGDLVPYGEVWRTGANEATTFETSKDITVGGETLAAGKYSLWTIPEKDSWTVIFNDKMYGWGVGRNGASRKADFDAMQVKVPVQTQENVVEAFTISFGGTDSTGTTMDLAWDQTKISVPIQ